MSTDWGTSHRMTRRRFIAIAAAAGGVSALPGLARGGAAALSYDWQGIALGASASIRLQHPDEAAAKLAIEACLAEVARLEAILSLNRPDSALSRLNAEGRLDDAPGDLRVVLAEALALAARTDGAFDPTVQPLWSLYARHFDRPGADPAGPAEAEIKSALKRTGWQRVLVDGTRIRFREPGIALTLNGIAQGYITDRVGEVLRQRGFEHVLVNMGEQLALGPKWTGEDWRVGIADPVSPGRILTEVPLSSGAMATSGSAGCQFDAAGRFTHILDPATGLPSRRLASVTVIAPSAMAADGLSTALAVVSADKQAGLIDSGARAFVVPVNGGSGYWL